MERVICHCKLVMVGENNSVRMKIVRVPEANDTYWMNWMSRVQKGCLNKTISQLEKTSTKQDLNQRISHLEYTSANDSSTKGHNS